MPEFVPGQRWVADAEPDLGLGVVLSVDGRAVTLAFPQATCERHYAKAEAPLTRIIFEPGDEIQKADGSSAIVEEIFEQGGLVLYGVDGDQLVPETSLASEIKMKQPLLRLLTGQLDKPQWFAFRRKYASAISQVWQSHLVGLLGARANLISHQLYVTWSACERERVRVLLADEVGLGKTLEAGMILSRMLRTERVSRCIIFVPDALQIQWLVELIRRFNLIPDLFAGAEHDFNSGSIHLIPHSAMDEAEQFEPFLGEFDLVIVDEAHHLVPETPAFELLRQLSERSEHLVLLSATPEQLGIEGHFARLQLLDSAKFNGLEQFLEQEESYSGLNQKIKNLASERDQVVAEYGIEPSSSDQEVIDYLLDCHGVGRVMFRNTRAAVSGFPSRVVEPHELDDDSWDAKYEWLATWSKQNSSEKILVICHSKVNALECETYLWDKYGVDVSLFHEDMDLIERDRAAAYFADMEGGCQLLICSEIGSEGRNFQFSHHLVCLDLPEHPDLLEQRIGRLDRIGQTQDVHIHILFAEGSNDALRFHWLNETLDCIAQQNPAAGSVHDAYWFDFVAAPESSRTAIEKEARARCQQLQQEIHDGRDALLELNSCRQPAADDLLTRIAEFEQHTPFELVETASDLFNFHFEESHDGAYSVIPSDNMMVHALPGVPPDGFEVTFDRSVANAREDLVFLSWDSPFISGLWEMMQQSDLGSASVALFPNRQLPAGQCLLETNFNISIQSEYAASCWPFLPDLSVRALVLDMSEKDLSKTLPEQALEKLLNSVEKKLARKIVLSRKEQIPQWYHRAEEFAEAHKALLIDEAIERASKHYHHESQRLRFLAEKNPSVSEEEVAAIENKRDQVVNALRNQVNLNLAAIRLIVTTD